MNWRLSTKTPCQNSRSNRSNRISEIIPAITRQRGERIEGGREINRTVDLSTLPLYVRAGAILPMGPVPQYTDEKTDGLLALRIDPGADGAFTLYEDDGVSFSYRDGDWMGITMTWDDKDRRLSLRLADGSRMRPPLERRIEGRLAPAEASRTFVFSGKPVETRW